MAQEIGEGMSHDVIRAKNIGKLIWVFIIAIAAFANAQQSMKRLNPGSPCAAQSKGLPDFYREAVLSHIEPPDWKHSLLRISIGKEKKLALWTDGDRFRLWTNTFDMAEKTVGEFLFRLDDSCRLPADPAQAAALVRVKWESADLSAEQFAEIHQHLVDALSQYVAQSARKYPTIMSTKSSAIYLDARMFSIRYENGYERLTVDVIDDPKEQGPMLDWIYQLEKLAEGKFHRPIWKIDTR